MKKITIVTAVAGVLALAPLMTGCGEGEDDANVIDDIPEEEEGEEGEEGEFEEGEEVG